VNRKSVVFGVLLLGLAFLLRAQNEPAIEDNDTSPYHQAMLAYKTGHYDEARTAIDAAEKAKPDDLPTALLKARILTEQHDFTDGEKLLLRFMSADGPVEVELGLGDLLLRKHSFDRAAKYYTQALAAKPNDPDIVLKLVYAEINISDLVDAGKNASHLKPLDADHPSYYFAKAALARATGKTQEEEDNIQTARTIYGITVTNRYLKTYLQVFASTEKNSTGMEPSPLLKTVPDGAK
jgi:Tfp pilus assembly protein PilF